MSNIPKIYNRDLEISQINNFCEFNENNGSLLTIRGQTGTGKTLLIQSVQHSLDVQKINIKCTDYNTFLTTFISALISFLSLETLKKIITPIMASSLNGHLNSQFEVNKLLFIENAGDKFESNLITISESLCIILSKICNCNTILFIDDFQFSNESEKEILNKIHNFISMELTSCKILLSWSNKSETKSLEINKFNEIANKNIVLTSFSKSETYSLIESKLGFDFNIKFPNFSNDIWKLTRGNPFHIIKCLKSLQSKNILKYDKGYWILNKYNKNEISNNLIIGIKDRIKFLEINPTELSLCSIISCLEENYSPQFYSDFLNITSEKLIVLVENLVKKDIISYKLEFINPLIRYEFYNKLSKEKQNNYFYRIIKQLNNKNDIPNYIKANYYEKLDIINQTMKKEVLLCLKKAVKELFGKSNRLEDLKRWIKLIYNLENNKKVKDSQIYKIAYLEYQLGNTNEAIKQYERALNQLNGSLRLELINDFVPVLRNLNEIKRADTLLSQGIKEAIELNDETNLSCLLLSRAKGLKIKLDDPLWSETDKFFEKMKPNKTIRINLARYFSIKIDQLIIANKWDDVKLLAKKALIIGEKEKCYHTCGTIHSNLFFMYLVSGNMKKSLEHVALSRKYAQKYGHPHYITWAKGSTGQALIHCGKPKEELSWLEDSVKEFSRMDKNISIQTPILNLAETLIKLGKWNRAELELLSYKNIFEKNQTQQTYSMFYIILGNAQVLSGKRVIGRKTILKGISIAEKMNMNFYSGQGYGYLGDSYYYQKKSTYKKALDFYLKADEQVYSNPALGHHGVFNAFKVYYCFSKIMNSNNELKKWIKEIKKRRKESSYNIEIEAEFHYINNSPNNKYKLLIDECLEKNNDSLATTYFFTGLNHFNKLNSNNKIAIENIFCGILLFSEQNNFHRIFQLISSLPTIIILPGELNNKHLIVHLILLLGGKNNIYKPFERYSGTKIITYLNLFLENIQFQKYCSFKDIISKLDIDDLIIELNKYVEGIDNNPKSPLGIYLNNKLKKNGIKRILTQTPVSQININTMGDLSVDLNGQSPIPHNWILQSRRLLSYLLTKKLQNQQYIPKLTIIEDLWRNEEPKLLDKRLRQTLYLLRHLFNIKLKKPFIEIKGNNSYGLSNNGLIYLDAEIFINGYKTGRNWLLNGKKFKAILEFEQVIQLYNGKYLQGMDELWSQNLRQDIDRYFYFMLDCLCEYYQNINSIEMIHYYASKVRRIDPLEECGIFWQIKAWLLQRKRSTAKREFNKWEQFFFNEMEIHSDISFQEILSVNTFKELWDK